MIIFFTKKKPFERQKSYIRNKNPNSKLSQTNSVYSVLHQIFNGVFKWKFLKVRCKTVLNQLLFCLILLKTLIIIMNE